MKIAVCFSGHMRNYEDTFPTWKRFLLDIHDCDVFIHTWSNRGMFTPKDGVITKYDEVGTVSETDNSVDFGHVQNLLKPVKFVSEAYSSVKPMISEKAKKYYEWRDSIKGWEYTRPHDYISFSYKIWACNELTKQTNVKYDLVIRARTDLKMNGPFPNEVFEHPEFLWLRSGHPSDMARDPNPKSVVQEIGLSNSQTMDIFANLYLHMDELLEEAKATGDPSKILNQHTSTWYWLVKNNIQYRHIPYHNVTIAR